MRALLTIVRIGMGFAGLTAVLLCAAWGLGLIPDRQGAVLRGRKYQAEALAIYFSSMAQQGNTAAMKDCIQEIAARNPEIISAGLRDDQGQLTVEVGDHAAHWTNLQGPHSTENEIKVPIALQDKLWGTVELRFVPLTGSGFFAILNDPVLRLVLFMTGAGIVLYSAFVWRILRGVLSFSGSSTVPKRIRATMDTFAEGVVILDKDQKIALANAAFAGLAGKKPGEIEGQAAASLPWVRAESQDESAAYPWQQSLVDGSAQTGAVVGLQINDRRPQTLSVNTTPIIGPDGSQRGALATFDNLTEIEKKNDHLRKLTDRLKQSKAEIQKQNKKLEYLATRDGLTGCLNRRAFLEELETQWNSALRYGYPLSCVMLDIDYFKGVNDSHGHAVGDQILVHVARQLDALKRAGDVLGRYGGEEFCLLLPHTDIEAAAAAAERLRQGIAESKCEPIGVTVSIGVSATSLGAEQGEALLVQADHALYAAKRAGRNRAIRWDRIEAASPASSANAPPRRPAPPTQVPGPQVPEAEEVKS
ncbi:hypothetical protein AYO44_03105 [Planctomycetaceae bacterium SCGC AG-212-F19]|nr:hypothetical protein AYO44_03105 [Planctomycetaceae bacterium SCGC AG-212-F19]